MIFLLICVLFTIFAYGNAYAYKTYEYIWKLAYCPGSVCTPQTRRLEMCRTKLCIHQ